MSDRYRLIAIWLFAGFVTLLVTMQLTTASYVGGQYLPVGQDSFYHARRILDAVATGHLYQFDPYMHAPDGDWITWPWAYDSALAGLVRIFLELVPAADPTAVLMHLPPLLGIVSVGVVVGIGARMRLPHALVVVAALCFALHAFTEYQFGVGSLDHHGAEQLATLGALWLGLRWFEHPGRLLHAGLLGLWLGASVGVHTGLFVLQLPVLAATFLLWVNAGGLPTRQAAICFAASLLAGTLLILVPAQTFWLARFDVYYLSLLQLYVSLCTAVAMVFMCWHLSSRLRILQLAAISILLAAPLFSAVMFSKGFLSGDLATISGIDEIRSPFAIASEAGGFGRISKIYTLLIWALPASWFVSLVMVWRERRSHQCYFWIACAFGLTLLPLQLRMASFGIFYLYLPLLMVAAAAMSRWPGYRQWHLAALVITLCAAYYPTIRYQLTGPNLPAAEIQFATIQPLIPVLRDACARDPGIVLAEPGDGHIIRYFTKCAVIANNFRLTPRDVEMVQKAMSLISRPVEEVKLSEPQIKYVVARLVAPVETEHPVLFEQLLQSKQLPGGVEPLVQLTVTHEDGRAEKFLGVYRLH